MANKTYGTIEETKAFQVLSYITKAIDNINNAVNNVKGNILEVFATITYAVSHLVMAIFHEPWFDESVAWQIARCASISEILFVRPHYEGHPPLWHLILMPFAKLGAPYELSLTVISLIFAGAAVGLIIWKSPFPRIIRLLLPFTYFFFYQYGVISRPYCVMMLAFVLLAISYSSRNEKPLRYTLCLALLCLTSAYGIVIAAGIAAVWLWEIWDKENIFSFIKKAFRDKRIYCLAGLLVFALILVIGIIPYEDTYGTNMDRMFTHTNHWLVRLLYVFFGLPSDCVYTYILNGGFLKYAHLSLYDMMSGCYIGLIIWSILLYFGRKKGQIKLFVIPCVMFCIFSSLVYLCTHHIGIFMLFVLFWVWVSASEKDIVKTEVKITKGYGKVLKSFATIFLCVGLIVSLTQTVTSCIADITSSYAIGRSEAKFIKENGLDKYNIMAAWKVVKDDDGEILAIDTNYCGYANNVAPYFEHNIFFNFNDGKDDEAYMTHCITTDEENQENFSKWEKIKPDVLYMCPELEMVYDEDELSMSDYTLVYSKEHNSIWKGVKSFYETEIYVRDELAEELGLEKVK
ncbi:MAG: hypothetical protein IKU41_02925 [Clostridia bacterium]|nr:hypothetical protein [Clostridia bacterium]